MITTEHNQARNLIDAATSSATYANDVARMANQYSRERNIPAAKAAYLSAMEIFKNNLIAIDDLPQMSDQHIQSMKPEERLELMGNLIRVTYKIPTIVSDIENSLRNVPLTKEEFTECIWYHDCIYIGIMKAISRTVVQKANLFPYDMEVNEGAKRNILQCYQSGQKLFKGVSDTNMRDGPVPFPRTREQTFIKALHDMNEMRDTYTKMQARVNTIVA